MPAEALLEIDVLHIGYETAAGFRSVVNDVSFSVGTGEIYGLVGESGSGKSTLALALVGYLGRAGRIAGGRILFAGRNLAGVSEAELRALRGARIAMVYQDAASSLNPTMTVGKQLTEVPLAHRAATAAEARERALALLDEVRIGDPAAMFDRYPHQLSGGQQQRVVIAMALMMNPALLIMDEPTSGLDVTTEATILDLVRELRDRHGTAVLFISHNLAAVARLCDRAGVLYRGELVEQGAVFEMLRRPQHPYTRALLACLPAAATKTEASGPPLIAFEGVGKTYRTGGLFKAGGTVEALRDVSFAVEAGRTLAIVGESGSGKSTLAKILVGLEQPTEGRVVFAGVEIGNLPVQARSDAIRREIQMVFQDPDATLNPTHTVGFAIGRAVKRLGRLHGRAAKDRARELLALVQLPAAMAAAFPNQLSGGQKQRVAIARALAGNPRLLVADEPTSALDVAVQSAILELLVGIQADQGMTLLLISHNLAVVRSLADTVAVFHRGQLVDFGTAPRVFAPPFHPYTETLLLARSPPQLAAE